MNQTNRRDIFDQLRQGALAATVRGDLDRAEAAYDEALDWARRHGDADDVDLIRCNQLAVQIHRGDVEPTLRELQTILMRSRTATNRHLAAYNISVFYDLRDDTEKSRFYGRLALDHAERSGSALFQARSYNRLGNVFIRESRFEEALEQYGEAIRLFSDEQLFERLTLQINIGYCDLACGRVAEGFEQLFAVRRSYIRHGVAEGHAAGRLRLSFCFGYLEIGKGHAARLHGRAGLEIAERSGDRDLEKKALYLLGEAEKLAGDEMSAFARYARLQEDFYPDTPYLPSLLMDNDTNQLVNLWA